MRGVAFALLLGLASGPSLAQAGLWTPGAVGAEATVQTYIDALSARDYVGAARLLEPGEVGEFVGFLRAVDGVTSGAVSSGPAYRDAVYPGMSGADKIEMAKALRPTGGNGLSSALASEDPVEAMAAFFETVLGQTPLLSDAMETVDARILGSVLEADSLAHVVGRFGFEMMGTNLGGVQVTTARWTGERWVISFDEKLHAFRTLFESLAPDMGVNEDDG